MIVVKIESQEVPGNAMLGALLDQRHAVSGVPENAQTALYASNDGSSLFLVDLFAHEQPSDMAALYGVTMRGGKPAQSGLPADVYTFKPRDVVHVDAPNDAVSVCAILRPLPDESGALYDLLVKMMTETRREPGNFYYNLFQSNEDGSLWMFESYADAAALQTHRTSRYYQTHVPEIASKLSAPIRVLSMINQNPVRL
jgi:quinol monooxygenase YgiN